MMVFIDILGFFLLKLLRIRCRLWVLCIIHPLFQNARNLYDELTNNQNEYEDVSMEGKAIFLIYQITKSFCTCELYSWLAKRHVYLNCRAWRKSCVSSLNAYFFFLSLSFASMNIPKYTLHWCTFFIICDKGTCMKTLVVLANKSRLKTKAMFYALQVRLLATIYNCVMRNSYTIFKAIFIWWRYLIILSIFYPQIQTHSF